MENVLEKAKILVEAALPCGACGIIIDRHVSHHLLSCNLASMQLTEHSPSPIKTMADLPTLDQAHFAELTQTVRGEVYHRGNHQYVIANICSIIRAQFLCSYLGFKSIHAYSMETF